MSEQTPAHEHQTNHEDLTDHEQSKQVAEAIANKGEEARKKSHDKESLKALAENAERQAEASENIKPDKQIDKEPDTDLGMQQLLKSNAYEHTLRRVQQKLPKTARAFSKIAHNKTVETVSNVSAQTVGRPSGILGGSICALMGSLILLYYSRHYGFKYNYSLFFLLFIGGFLVGALAELAIWLLYSRKQRRY